MKSKQRASAATGNAKVFMMLIEGDSATVQRAVEAAERTITKSNGYSLRADLDTPRVPAVALPTYGGSDAALDGDEPESVATPHGIDSVGTSETRPSRKRTFKVPEILDELKANEEPNSFKAFVAGRSLEADVDRGLAVAVWLKEKRDVRGFDTNHLHTCFSMIQGWRLPDDPGSLLRNMKRNGLVRSVSGKRGTFELTSAGANRFQEKVG